jgi:DNA-binding CsgD family transcriptional regulator
MSFDTDAWIIRGLALNLEVEQIAEDLAVSEDYVKKIAVKQGVRFADHKQVPKKEMLKTLHTQGKTDKEIASILDISLHYVQLSRRRLGLTANHPDSLLRDGIATLHQEGKSDYEIAKILGKTLQNIRTTRSKMKLRAIPPRTQADEIRKRRAAGERNIDIAKSLGIRPCQVSRAALSTRKIRPSRDQVISTLKGKVLIN